MAEFRLSDEEIRRLGVELQWSDAILSHALLSAGNDYGDECVITTVHGVELHCPPYPQECEYVRVVQAGCEIGYWTADEWRDSPQDVMGAIMGAAARGAATLQAAEVAGLAPIHRERTQ